MLYSDQQNVSSLCLQSAKDSYKLNMVTSRQTVYPTLIHLPDSDTYMHACYKSQNVYHYTKSYTHNINTEVNHDLFNSSTKHKKC